MITPAQHAGIAVVTFVGSIANSIAGGGTLLTLPALVGFGVPSIVANATSCIALLPGTISSMHGYRHEVRKARAIAYYFALPSVLGGLIGGLLLTVTSQKQFDFIVPFLVGFATIVFVLQRPILAGMRRWSNAHPAPGDVATRRPPNGFLIMHFFVSIYGGYSGGGAGMIILASLGLMGLTNIHQMNGLKNFFALTFNVVAIFAFMAKGLIDWPIAATMGVGSVLGGFVGSRVAQRVPQSWVRGSVGVIGAVAAGWLFLHLH